eukprot:NODE_169_length_14535_cov_0.769881.p8 type:complete len:126 gc:universal NODE_169_length_14535_cov_0.769881:5479-5856(+)
MNVAELEKSKESLVKLQLLSKEYNNYRVEMQELIATINRENFSKVALLEESNSRLESEIHFLTRKNELLKAKETELCLDLIKQKSRLEENEKKLEQDIVNLKKFVVEKWNTKISNIVSLIQDLLK